MAFGDLVGTVATNSSSGTAPSGTLSTTPTVGNRIFCAVMTGDGTTLNAPTGWSTGLLVNNSQAGEEDLVACFYRDVQSGDGTTVTCSSGDDEWAIIVWELEGPFVAGIDAAYENARVANASTYTMSLNGASTAQDSEVLIAFLYSRSQSTSYSGWTSSFTELGDVASSYKRVGAAIKVISTAEAPSTTTTLGVNATSKGGMVAFKEDVGGGGFQAAWARNSNQIIG